MNRAVVFVLAGLPVLAQTPADVIQHKITTAIPGMPGAFGVEAVEFISAEASGPLGLVKGAPYSAEIVSESTQMLGDGTRIVQKNTQSFARDSEGRTRREMNVSIPGKPAEDHKIIMIDDPVAGVHYVLNTRDKTARKMTMPKLEGSGSVSHQFTAPDDVFVFNRTIRAGNVQAFPGRRVPAPEQLGKQTMEGVDVTGTRTTVTIPAGEIGNDRAIVSTFESWYSGELKTPILSKRTDPRMGDSTTRTTGIRRGEQPRTLFEVPADYTAEEMKPGMMMKKMRTASPDLL